MLGYKYTNIKIQVALIKQIIYSYLFNLFISHPNSFVKLILTNFSKDALGVNSKEQYKSFIKSNQNIFSAFYKELPLKVRKYMFLTLILNKDMKTNFTNLNNQEVETLGIEELENVFFDVIFDFLDKIKKEFNIDLEKLLTLQNQDSESKTSLEDLFKTSKLILNGKNIGKPILFQELNGNTVNLNESDKEGLKTNLIKYQQGLLKDELLLRKLFDSSYGIHGEFYYKIKDRLDVRLSCGNTTRENIIIFSVRNITDQKENKEILGVQQYFNWKKDESYENLDQFIFVRDSNIKQNLDFNNNKFFTYQTKFDNQKYIGAKILNKKEILELREKLESSNDNSGFLAIIPLKIINEKDNNEINNFLQNLSNLKNMYLSGFSQKEKNFKMSAVDVLKLLGTKNEGPLSSRTIVYQTNPYNSFDINELFDVYFSVLNSSHFLGEISKNNFSQEEILKKELDLSSKIPEKEGKFLLDFKLVEDIFINLNTIKYFTTKRTKILDIKLSTSNEEKFNDFGDVKSYLSDINLDDPKNSFIINSFSTGFLRKTYYDKFLNTIEKDEFTLIKNSLFPSDIFGNNVVEKINFKVSDSLTISENLKFLRSYKNYSDFLNYYINIVEALAKESADRV